MTITENVYTCLTCRQQHGDAQLAMLCHKKGWIRQPVPLQPYDLDNPTLLMLATATNAGLHRN